MQLPDPNSIVKHVRQLCQDDHKAVCFSLVGATLESILAPDNGLQGDENRLSVLTQILEFFISKHTELRVKIDGTDRILDHDNQIAARLSTETQVIADHAVSTLHHDKAEAAALAYALISIVEGSTDPLALLGDCLAPLIALKKQLEQRLS